MLNGACDTADTGPPVFYDDNRQGENGTEQIPCNRYRRIQRQAHYRLAGERANPDGVNVLPWMLCGTTEIGEARLKRYGDLHEDHAPSPGQHDHGRADASAGKKIRRESTGRLSGLNRRMHYRFPDPFPGPAHLSCNRSIDPRPDCQPGSFRRTRSLFHTHNNRIHPCRRSRWYSSGCRLPSEGPAFPARSHHDGVCIPPAYRA